MLFFYIVFMFLVFIFGFFVFKVGENSLFFRKVVEEGEL